MFERRSTQFSSTSNKLQVNTKLNNNSNSNTDNNQTTSTNIKKETTKIISSQLQSNNKSIIPKDNTKGVQIAENQQPIPNNSNNFKPLQSQFLNYINNNINKNSNKNTSENNTNSNNSNNLPKPSNESSVSQINKCKIGNTGII